MTYLFVGELVALFALSLWLVVAAGWWWERRKGRR